MEVQPRPGGSFKCLVRFAAVLCTLCLTASGHRQSSHPVHDSASTQSLEHSLPHIALAIQGRTRDVDKWISLYSEMHTKESVTLFISTYDEPGICPSGIFCYYHPNSTWSQGRNELGLRILQKEVEARQKFKYWAFHDSDSIVLDCWICRHTPTTNSRSACCYDQYIYFLQGPQNFAVVSPGHPNHLVDVPPSAAAIKQADCLDGMKNAIHREAVPVLFPYIEDLDSTSWWISQGLQFQLVSGCLSGFSAILGGYREGPEEMEEHSPYPRGMNHTQALKTMEEVFGNAGLMPLPITGTEYPQGDCTGLGPPQIVTDLVFDSAAWMESIPFLLCRKGLSSRFEKFTASAYRGQLAR